MSGSRSNSSFLIAAELALTHANVPLTAKELVETAVAHGHLKTNGLTPVKTMNARLSEDILAQKAFSKFMRISGGRFALRSWSDTLPERIAPRRTIALTDEYVLAFDARLLKEFIPEEGLHKEDDTHHRLLAAAAPVKRSEAEERYDIVQLVSVYIVRHLREILTYKRSKRLPEGRLHHKYLNSPEFSRHPRCSFSAAVRS